LDLLRLLQNKLLKGDPVNWIAVLMALLPIIVIFLLLVLRRTAADVAGAVGWVVALSVAWLYFKTRSRSHCGPAWAVW